MNYTEEQYSELYNNLPKGLRDLVLTGELSTQVSALGMKYGLTPEETTELEPAVEDLALGLILPEDLSENIFIQTGVAMDKAESMAGEVLSVVYRDLEEELRLTRKYKIELDTRLREAEESERRKIEANKTDVQPEKVPVAGNIINITKETKTVKEKTVSPDEKVATWFAGKSVSTTNTRAELDSLSDNTFRQIPISKPIEPVVKPTVSANNKSAWDAVMSASPNNLKPKTAPVPSPSRDAQAMPVQGQSGNTDKSFVQVEQQIFTLTQAVNKMIEQNNKTINPVIQSVFNTGQYEEVNKRLEALTKRLDDLQNSIVSLKGEVGNLKSNQNKAVSTASSVVTNTEIKKENPIDKIMSMKIDTHPAKVQSFTGNDINIKKEEVVKTPTANIVPIVKKEEVKFSGRDQLLKDLEALKQRVSTASTNTVIPEPIAKEAIQTNSLKEEILAPRTTDDKVQALQQKIAALNMGKNIIQGGVVSAGGEQTDPYRQ